MPDSRDETIRKVASLRSRGRYQEALHQLETSEGFADGTFLRTEKALIYVLQHRHSELLQLLPEESLDEVYSESKGESLSRILRDLARIHEELRLREAVVSAEVVAERWLVNRENQEYDRLDVYMISLYAIIQRLGENFLTNSESEEAKTELPSETMLHALCSSLLQSSRFEELLVVKMLEAGTALALEGNPSFHGILVHILAHSTKTEAHEDFEAHIRLLLYETCPPGDEQDEIATAELQKLQGVFVRTGNANGVLWVRFHTIISCGGPKLDETVPFEEVLNQFKRLNDWRGVQMCSFEIAKIHRRKREFKTYTSTLLSLLTINREANNGLSMYESSTKLYTSKFPAVKQALDNQLAGSTIERSKKRPGKARHEANKRQKADLQSFDSTNRGMDQRISNADSLMDRYSSNSPGGGSMFNFWQSYMALLGEDLKDNGKTGSVIAICSRFFEKHPECSIPQLQYLLAITISESYGESSNVPMVMIWAAKALNFAKAADDKELIAEARSHLEGRLTSYAAAPSGDSTGMGLREKNMSRMVDLEILYQETGTHGHFIQQYEYAKCLLDMQLSAEIKSKINPVGEPWLSRTMQTIAKLPDSHREKARCHTNFAIAHAHFEFGDYNTALVLLDKIIDSSGKIGDGRLRSHALFTKGRVYLQLYLGSNGETAWENSHRNLQASSQISAELGRLDDVACCHTVLATLWQTKVPGNLNAGFQALHHIEEAEKIWSEEIENMDVLLGLNSVVSKYSLRYRNLDNSYDVFGTAFSICFETGDFIAAWKWAQRAKARVFYDSLSSLETPVHVGETATHQPHLTETKPEREILYVHWVTAGEKLFLLTCRPGKSPQMFLLDISFSVVSQWYSDLIDSQDDLSDAESAEEILAELNALVEPLGRDKVSTPGELLVLCPTKLLFKIPLHALSVGDEVLLSRNPILYAHVIPPPEPQRQYPKDTTKQPIDRESQIILFGNPTGDVASGEESVNMLGETLGGRVFVEKEATKETYMSLCLNSRLVHYHGHVVTYSQAMRNSMIFHEGALQAKEVFSLDMHRFSPLICLIGCGSGTQALQPGDEPLGFVPAFLYAGASAVVATLWPIHDSLSGAAFTKIFYEGFMQGAEGGSKPVDLALSLQKAALAIRSREETRAPYFWAGFVLHGQWSFRL